MKVALYIFLAMTVVLIIIGIGLMVVGSIATGLLVTLANMLNFYGLLRVYNREYPEDLADFFGKVN